MIFGIAVFINGLVLNTVHNNLDTTGYLTGQAKITSNAFLNSVKVLDYCTVLLLAGLIIAIGLSSYRIAAAPGFFIATILMAPILGFISYFFNYVFAQIVSQSVFSTIFSLYPRTVLVCTNLHWVMLVLIVVGSVTLYGKNPDRGQFQ